jgi:hypothetical protein
MLERLCRKHTRGVSQDTDVPLLLPFPLGMQAAILKLIGEWCWKKLNLAWSQELNLFQPLSMCLSLRQQQRVELRCHYFPAKGNFPTKFSREKRQVIPKRSVDRDAVGIVATPANTAAISKSIMQLTGTLDPQVARIHKKHVRSHLNSEWKVARRGSVDHPVVDSGTEDELLIVKFSVMVVVVLVVVVTIVLVLVGVVIGALVVCIDSVCLNLPLIQFASISCEFAWICCEFA